MPSLPPPGRKRKHRPISVERDACLYRLGVDPTKPWQMQHDPPLGIRPFNVELDDYEPAENDPRFMYPMQEPAHKEVTSKVDRPAIDKARRQAKKEAAHQERMAVKPEKTKRQRRKKAWAKRKIPSRPFRR